MARRRPTICCGYKAWAYAQKSKIKEKEGTKQMNGKC
jgi:hypothetical protein